MFVGLNGAMIINLPTLTAGRSLYLSSGFVGAFVALFVCCFIFYILSSTMMSLSFNDKAGTFEIAETFFGKKGATFCACVISMVFCVWCVLQLVVIKDFFQQIPFFCDRQINKIRHFDLLFFLFFAVVALLGRMWLFVTAYILVPTVIFLELSILFFSREVQEIVEGSSASFFNLLDLSVIEPLLSGLSATILVTPALCRSVVTRKDTIKNLKIVYLILLPFSSGIGIVLGSYLPFSDFFPYGLCYNQKTLIITALYMFISGCTINTMNIYFAVNSLTYIIKKKNRILPIFVVSGICLLLTHLKPFLAQIIEFLNSMLASILTIIVVRSAKKLRFGGGLNRNDNVFVLAVSVVAVFLCSLGYIEVTGTPFFDTMVLSTVLCLYFSTISNKQRIVFDE
jgi:hypothetical protein